MIKKGKNAGNLSLLIPLVINIPCVFKISLIAHLHMNDNQKKHIR